MMTRKTSMIDHREDGIVAPDRRRGSGAGAFALWSRVEGRWRTSVGARGDGIAHGRGDQGEDYRREGHGQAGGNVGKMVVAEDIRRAGPMGIMVATRPSMGRRGWRSGSLRGGSPPRPRATPGRGGGLTRKCWSSNACGISRRRCSACRTKRRARKGVQEEKGDGHQGPGRGRPTGVVHRPSSAVPGPGKGRSWSGRSWARGISGRGAGEAFHRRRRPGVPGTRPDWRSRHPERKRFAQGQPLAWTSSAEPETVSMEGASGGGGRVLALSGKRNAWAGWHCHPVEDRPGLRPWECRRPSRFDLAIPCGSRYAEFGSLLPPRRLPPNHLRASCSFSGRHGPDKARWRNEACRWVRSGGRRWWLRGASVPSPWRRREAPGSVLEEQRLQIMAPT